MEKIFAEQPESRVAAARRTIAESPNAIENEFRRTKNTWPECFGSRVFPIETYLNSDKVKTELGEEKYTIILARLAELKQRLYEMKEQYPNKDVPPPEDEKKRMLEQLDVLK